MVNSEEIKNKYILLLELVRNEARINSSILDYYYYLEQYADRFIHESNFDNRRDLKEFLRGANRYSDEFIFSEENHSQIRSLTNNLYELLQ